MAFELAHAARPASSKVHRCVFCVAEGCLSDRIVRCAVKTTLRFSPPTAGQRPTSAVGSATSTRWRELFVAVASYTHALPRDRKLRPRGTGNPASVSFARRNACDERRPGRGALAPVVPVRALCTRSRRKTHLNPPWALCVDGLDIGPNGRLSMNRSSLSERPRCESLARRKLIDAVDRHVDARGTSIGISPIARAPRPRRRIHRVLARSLDDRARQRERSAGDACVRSGRRSTLSESIDVDAAWRVRLPFSLAGFDFLRARDPKRFSYCRH